MDLPLVLSRTLVYGLPFLTASYLLVGIAMFRRTEGKRTRWFSWLMVSVATYCFGYFLELNSRTLEVLLAVRVFELLGALLIPAFGLLFVADLSGSPAQRGTAFGLLAASGLLWVALVTDPLHHQFYRSVGILVGEFTVPVTEKGPLYYVFLGYVGVFLAWSSVRLRNAWKASRKRARRDSLRFVFLAFQLPWLALGLIVAGWDQAVDPVPPTILAVCVLFLVNEARNGMFDLQVKRWKGLFQGLKAPAFLLDTEGEVAGTNPEGERLLEATGPNVLSLLKSCDAGHRTLELTVESSRRWFSVTVSPYDQRQELTSYWLSDITDNQTAMQTILREVHHRVKNNMNTVIGLLTLQANTLEQDGARRVLEDASSRVQSMAILYDKLYLSSDFSTVSASQYFPELVHEILANFPNQTEVETEVRVDDFPLGEKTIQPLGIILNELLTNIMKYAFQGRERGKILVVLSRDEASIRLVVQDDGNGMPESIDFENSTGFGLMLLNTLAKHLRGSIRIERGAGTKIELTFPV